MHRGHRLRILLSPAWIFALTPLLVLHAMWLHRADPLREGFWVYAYHQLAGTSPPVSLDEITDLSFAVETDSFEFNDVADADDPFQPGTISVVVIMSDTQLVPGLYAPTTKEEFWLVAQSPAWLLGSRATPKQHEPAGNDAGVHARVVDEINARLREHASRSVATLTQPFHASLITRTSGHAVSDLGTYWTTGYQTGWAALWWPGLAHNAIGLLLSMWILGCLVHAGRRIVMYARRIGRGSEACSDCGYDVRSTPANAPCPECGSCDASLPAQRTKRLHAQNNDYPEASGSNTEPTLRSSGAE